MLPYGDGVAVGAQRISDDGSPCIESSEIRLQNGAGGAETEAAPPPEDVHEIVHLALLRHQVGGATDVRVQSLDPVHGHVYAVGRARSVHVDVLDMLVRQQHLEYPRADRMAVCYRAYVPDDRLDIVRSGGLGDIVPSVGQDGSRHPLYGIPVEAPSPLAVGLADVLDQLQDLQVQRVGVGVLPRCDAVVGLASCGFADRHRRILRHIGCDRPELGSSGNPAVRVGRLGAHILACDGPEQLREGPVLWTGSAEQRGRRIDGRHPVALGRRRQRIEGCDASVLRLRGDYHSERGESEPHLPPPGIPARMRLMPSSIWSRALAVARVHALQSCLSSSIPSRRSLGAGSFSGKEFHAAVITSLRDAGHSLHLPFSFSSGIDQRIIDAASRITDPALPEISVSLPVRRTTLSALPVAAMVLTMHPRHSLEPGTGRNRHLLQSTIRRPPSSMAEGPLSSASPRSRRPISMSMNGDGL